MALSWSLDKLGPLCLTADDCGIVLEAISGPDPADSSTYDENWTYNPENRDFKLAVIENILEGKQKIVTDNFNTAIKKLEKFCTIDEIKFPDFPYEAVIRVILYGEAAAAFDNFTEKGLAAELTAPEDRYGPYARSFVLAKDYLRALRLREKMCNIAEDIMHGYDAVLAPTSSTIAHRIDQQFPTKRPGAHKDIMGAVGNCAGLPSISVPNGFNDEGLPTGIQFMGRSYDENIILNISRMYQERTNWHKRHPNMFLT
jgi:aspartyl-tRNA(Asn)/glutamyl-tRNA(Gln) amidotransferase subunit A